jgi:hypothetical protein
MIQRNKSKDMATFTREFKLISDQGTSLYTWIDDDHTVSHLIILDRKLFAYIGP